MYIVFNMVPCGLGNNGGTRTILLCQKTLEELGHKCDIIAIKDNFTWFSHKPIIKYVPKEADVIIATAWSTVANTINAAISKKLWYIRGHETWSTSEKNLINLYRDRKIKNVVNSKGLQALLKKFGVESDVIYQGIDLDLWQNEYLRPEHTLCIGCLYSTRAIKRWKDFEKLAEILGEHDYDYVAMGAEKYKGSLKLKKYLHNPSQKELRDLYSSCHIWYSPVSNEGLHNPPMEAALCGALILCNDKPSNGMIRDYASDSTAMIYRDKDIEHAASLVRNPTWEKIIKMESLIKDSICDRKTNMEKLIKIIEEM